MNRSMLNQDGSPNFNKLIDQLDPHVQDFGPTSMALFQIYAQIYLHQINQGLEPTVARQNAFSQLWQLVSEFSDSLTSARETAGLRAA